MPTTFTGGRGVNNADLDVPKRLSFVSGASQPKDLEEGSYVGVKTPDQVPIGSHYGGDFDFSLSFPQLMIIVAVLTIPVFPMTWFFIKEEKKEAANFKEYIASFWDLLTTRAVYQVIAYNFFANIFADITYTGSSPVQDYMLVEVAAKRLEV
ncbi:hypothetical protein PRNP1_015081 [Phytophthora ramorum]